ncbi:MAG TPA: aminopeptidase [Tenuifilaceae bacterium]|nr:aminopeptidase [Tenuifilaceae bacterium]HPE19352.1 aminopeptidase [Tenuifilaceae bacterium]HPJ46774.1 aminopeptidase [Tenuifilaceae bacterium]HPQ35324.1 aminopeptidase [Tenuifilaceae bacterium]HRX68415.1 aminopeptidase [Tenuifilaceae bacterium]
MNFSEKELYDASLIALRDCMGLKMNETLLIITDETRREIGSALHKAGKELCNESMVVEMKSREINGQEPPTAIAELMKMVDVVVCPTAKSLTHTNARREASKVGVRVGTMPGITVDTMVRCLNADYEKIVGLTNYIAKKLEGVKTIRVVTEKGTDVTMPVESRMIIPSRGVLREKGEGGNLPSGEVFLAPWEDKTNGRVVVDGSMASVGLCETPITIDIVNGYAETVTGGEEAKKLVELFEKSGREARAVAEFGIGTNYKAKLIGMILEDEKVLGTIHIAFGNNITMGGKISVSSHLDGLVKEPDVYFDDELVMKKGKMLGFEMNV